ncbi:Uu.00g147020.m01.CDS01 [Anthostomella pinea]|uniref:Uu.00g147020.m01.CDS01 n=1 Tax=Anthostomella pinea TaxID=933095 RepID=A0AAI8YJL5_9PEZI|nr:Uu.00g147020.m01.CDS01 [Anthostomella pinea]
MEHRQVDQAAPSTRLARFARMLLSRDDTDKCHPSPNINLCEKPSSNSKQTAIVVGITVGVFLFVVVVTLLYLHFRRKRLDKAEWPKTNQELEDYGFDVAPSGTGKPRKNNQQPQLPVSRPQLRNDDLHAPAKLSRNSRNSLDTLARSLRGQEANPYRARVEDDVTEDMKPVQPSDRV